MKYNTCEEIKSVFIADGWSSDIEFEELAEERAQSHGHFIKSAMARGMKFFVMVQTGNIFDDCGTVVYYNIPCNAEG